MESVHALIECYGAAWNVDEAERRELLSRCWADDGVYCDPTAHVEGRDALIDHRGSFQAVFPRHRTDPVSGVDEHHGRFRFAWVTREPGGIVLIEGMDFGVLSADGRIASITGFFGPLAGG